MELAKQEARKVDALVEYSDNEWALHKQGIMCVLKACKTFIEKRKGVLELFKKGSDGFRIHDLEEVLRKLGMENRVQYKRGDAEFVMEHVDLDGSGEISEGEAVMAVQLWEQMMKYRGREVGLVADIKYTWQACSIM